MPLHWIPTYRGFDHGSLKNDGKEIIEFFSHSMRYHKKILKVLKSKNGQEIFGVFALQTLERCIKGYGKYLRRRDDIDGIF
jgi:hypothetical protein